MDLRTKALELHKNNRGKIVVESKVPVTNREDLTLAYTPGVAEPCKEIATDKGLVYTYTSKGNMVAVVTDGSAVLGLGDIGPEAALPVMEGKAVLFKSFAGVDAFPICLDTRDTDEIVRTVKLISPGFGGINLEDISAPRCFEIENRLKRELDIPVFHDDQHGTAVVVLAALINALKIVGKQMKYLYVVINGAGAAGIAITKLLLKVGVKDIVLCDREGAIYRGRPGMNWVKEEIAGLTNINGKKGSLKEVLEGADVFIGVSAPNILDSKDIARMKGKAVVFPMANPIPEISPREAFEGGAAVVGTGRSDYPNQINNVLAFPGIFKGALEVRAREINDDMKIAAALAIADFVGDRLSSDRIIPAPFEPGVAEAVAEAVKKVAIEQGIARISNK
jgi:malate dehydrogenase (oxaloacetate-decarboxylating)